MDLAADLTTILADKKKPGAASTAPARHRRVQLPCAAHPTNSIGPLIRQLTAELALDMKDKTYRECPVGEIAGRYLDSIAFGCRPNTLESYEQVLAPFARAHDDLDGVQAFCDQVELVERYCATVWARKAPTTKRHHWQVLSGFFKWCQDRGLVTSNPMRGIRKPRAPRTSVDRRAYDQEQIATLIDAQPMLRDRAALGLLRLGLRKNDLRMLQLRDIDFLPEHAQLYLNHAKGGKAHRLPIVFEDVLADLNAHVIERNLERGGDAGDEYLLYPKNDRGRPMDHSSIHRWFKLRLEQARLPDTIKMHELRHTAADHLWRTTGNLILVQKFLRHDSPATTAAYVHPTEDDLREGLKLVDEAWRRL